MDAIQFEEAGTHPIGLRRHADAEQFFDGEHENELVRLKREVVDPLGIGDGLPVGLQFMAGALKEKNLFRVAYAYEQTTEWHTRTPSL